MQEDNIHWLRLACDWQCHWHPEFLKPAKDTEFSPVWPSLQCHVEAANEKNSIPSSLCVLLEFIA